MCNNIIMEPTKAIISIDNYNGLISIQNDFGIFSVNSSFSNFIESAKSDLLNPDLENQYVNLITNITELQIYESIDWSKIPNSWSEGLIAFKHNDNIVKSVTVFSHINSANL